MFEIRPIVSALIRNRVSAILLITQIAITMAVVSNASHIVFDRLTHANKPSGIVEEEVIGFNLFHYGKEDLDLSQQLREDELMLRNRPEILDATVTSSIPISNGGGNSAFWDSPDDIEGRTRINAGIYMTSDRFLTTLGLRLIAGRNFTQEEIAWDIDESDQVPYIVTKAFAEKLFPDSNALGKQVYDVFNVPHTIVGIVDVLHGPWPDWKEGFETNIISAGVHGRRHKNFLVRVSKENRESVLNNIESWIHENHPKRVVGELKTMEEIRASTYRGDIAMTKILVVVIILLLTITTLGFVGLVTFTINQRTKQIGTRRALGATRTAISRYFFVESSIQSCAGLLLGLIMTFMLNQYLVEQYSAAKIEPSYIAGTMILVFVLGLAAVLSPVLKVIKISPAIATRSV